MAYGGAGADSEAVCFELRPATGKARAHCRAGVERCKAPGGAWKRCGDLARLADAIGSRSQFEQRYVERGSLTIVASCLVETGSRLDEVVYEEFKGTGNLEMRLSRELADRRIFPAIDLAASSTRQDERLLSPAELRAMAILRRKLADLPRREITGQVISLLEKTSSNARLVEAVLRQEV